MADSTTLEKQLEREILARESAEKLLAERTTDLQETTNALQHRAQLLGDKTATLRQVQLELEQLRLRLILSEKMAAVGQLASGAAQQIQQPLGFIAENLNRLDDYLDDLHLVIDQQDQCLKSPGYFRLFKAGQGAKITQLKKLKKKLNVDFLVADMTSLLDDCIDGALSAQKMIDDLCEFSRTENTGLAEEDINDLLDRTVNLASNELHYRADVVKQYGNLPKILCDGGRLVHAFLNILLNAAEAIESKGTITLRTGVHSSMLWIDIADTGPGIPEDKLGKIFDPFFTSKEAGTGSGLGLHQVKLAVEAHHGRTTVMSRMGQGTTFRVMLPVDRYGDLAAN